MSNNFLDNYTKKSQENLSENPASVAPTPKPDTAQPKTAGNSNVAGDGMSFEQKSTFKPPAKRTSGAGGNKKFPVHYVIIGAIALIIIIVVAILLGRGTSVPNVVGWTQSQVELWGNENEVLLKLNTEFSDEVTAGNVISQNPVEGEALSGGEFFEVVVSGGPDQSVMIPLPDIMNMSIDEVEAWAEENKMTKVRVTTEESQTVPLGEVIEFTVNDNTVLGDEVRRDTPLYVLFSKGAGEGEAVDVPNFLTMSVAEAEKFGEDNDLEILLNEVYDDDVAKGQIMEQSIKAEETVHTGDVITLTVSLGKEILVPNFYSYDQDEGALQASQLGITTIVEEKYALGTEEGDLISQSMAAGTHYETGDYVELVYSLGDRFVIPSFIGSHEEAIREWIVPLNEQGCSLSINTRYTESDSAHGTVLSQDKVHLTIKIDETISFVVSEGKIIYVPDLVADEGSPYSDIVTREKAIEICNELGIVPVFTEENAPGRLPGEVWYQNIAAGTEVRAGATVELKYVPVVTTHNVPDFTGMTQADIVANGYSTMFTITYAVGDYLAGTEDKAVAQSAPAGSTVAVGTTIVVTLGAKTPPASSSTPTSSTSTTSSIPTS